MFSKILMIIPKQFAATSGKRSGGYAVRIYLTPISNISIGLYFFYCTYTFAFSVLSNFFPNLASLSRCNYSSIFSLSI